jgi:type IV pilus assembly protein PilV
MAHRSQRGFTLIEVMISLGILLVTLIGLMRLQIIGIGSNGGAHMHAQASELGQELAQGLERLQPTDPRLALTEDSGSTAPSSFGPLVNAAGAVVVGNSVAWSDTNPVPGVRTTAQIPTGYDRRWKVWGYSPTNGSPGALVIAVSVVWHEPALPRAREVVIYTQVPQPTTLMAGIAGNQ